MPRDWRELSEAASREQDPKKLLELVEELDEALEQREKAVRENRNPDENSRDQSDLRAMVPATVVAA